MITLRLVRALPLLLLTAFVAACGGGSSSSSAPPVSNNPPPSIPPTVSNPSDIAGVAPPATVAVVTAKNAN